LPLSGAFSSRHYFVIIDARKRFRCRRENLYELATHDEKKKKKKKKDMILFLSASIRCAMPAAIFTTVCQRARVILMRTPNHRQHAAMPVLLILL